jgi:hypothetical protein
MALTGQTADRTWPAAAAAGLAAIALCALALTLSACGSTASVQDSDARFDVPAVAPASSSASAAHRLAATVRAAQRAYNRETKGSKLRRETERIAHDAVLLRALARGDVAGAGAEANVQLMSRANHFDHVTRVSVVRGRRVLLNATLNSDGAFVVAPASRELQLRGRRLGTLLVSIQDVTGFVKLVHRRTLAAVVARGASGQVRTSLPSAAQVRLPSSGEVGIAGRSYLVRSFSELGWGGEALTVWVLKPR